MSNFDPVEVEGLPVARFLLPPPFLLLLLEQTLKRGSRGYSLLLYTGVVLHSKLGC